MKIMENNFSKLGGNSSRVLCRLWLGSTLRLNGSFYTKNRGSSQRMVIEWTLWIVKNVRSRANADDGKRLRRWAAKGRKTIRDAPGSLTGWLMSGSSTLRFLFLNFQQISLPGFQSPPSVGVLPDLRTRVRIKYVASQASVRKSKTRIFSSGYHRKLCLINLLG